MFTKKKKKKKREREREIWNSGKVIYLCKWWNTLTLNTEGLCHLHALLYVLLFLIGAVKISKVKKKFHLLNHLFLLEREGEKNNNNNVEMGITYPLRRFMLNLKKKNRLNNFSVSAPEKKWPEKCRNKEKIPSMIYWRIIIETNDYNVRTKVTVHFSKRNAIQIHEELFPNFYCNK